MFYIKPSADKTADLKADIIADKYKIYFLKIQFIQSIKFQLKMDVLL